jgi:hypothetical protein
MNHYYLKASLLRIINTSLLLLFNRWGASQVQLYKIFAMSQFDCLPKMEGSTLKFIVSSSLSAHLYKWKEGDIGWSVLNKSEVLLRTLWGTCRELGISLLWPPPFTPSPHPSFPQKSLNWINPSWYIIVKLKTHRPNQELCNLFILAPKCVLCNNHVQQMQLSNAPCFFFSALFLGAFFL